jgi:hypothetical protein
MPYSRHKLAVDSPAWFCLRILTICVVTYQGRVEAVSYAENAEMQAPKKSGFLMIVPIYAKVSIEFSTLEWCGFGGITM